MSCHTGPEIVESGLVFMYDAANTQKSWKGKPTVNYFTTPSVEVTKTEFGQYYNMVPIFETYGLVPYSLSFEMKANKPGTVLWYMQNGQYTKYTWVYTNRSVTTEWQRFTIENVTPAGPEAAWLANTPNDHRAMLATYTTYGSGVNPTVRNMQVELGSFSTPFVDGTRSDTLALLDPYKQNTITATALTYASDNTFSFDGVNDQLAANWAGVSTAGGAYTTVNMWLYWTGAQGGFPMEFSSGYRLWMPSGNMGFNNGNGDCYGIDFSSYANQWVNLTAMFYNGIYTNNSKLYVNGTLQSLTQRVGTATSGTVSASGTIGGYAINAASYPFPGKIALMSVYNRELTAEEVLRNYRVYRGRFGI